MKYISYSRRSIRFMEPIVKNGVFLAIMPNYDFDKEKILRKVLHQLYNLTIFLISVGLLFSGIYSAWSKRPNALKIFEFLLGLIAVCDMAIVFSISSLGSAFWNLNQWKCLFRSFMHLERYFNTETRIEKSFIRNIYLQYLLLNLLILINLVTSVFNRFKEVSMVFLVHVCFLFYVVQLRGIIMYNLILAIKCKYQDLNDFLIKKCIATSEDIGKCARKVSELYGLMNEIVYNFNKIFGWEILLILILAVVLQLLSFDFINMLRFREKGDVSIISRNIAIPLISIGIVSVIGPILVMFSCDWAIKEAEKLASTCYKYQAYFPTFSVEKQELLNLANQIVNNKPAFTAAGFFEVNCKTLFALFGTTTTYFIVIVQFDQM